MVLQNVRCTIDSGKWWRFHELPVAADSALLHLVVSLAYIWMQCAGSLTAVIVRIARPIRPGVLACHPSSKGQGFRRKRGHRSIRADIRYERDSDVLRAIRNRKDLPMIARRGLFSSLSYTADDMSI